MADLPTLPAGAGYPLVDATSGEFLSTAVNDALSATTAAAVAVGIEAADIPAQVEDGITDSPTVQAAIDTAITLADIPTQTETAVSTAVAGLDLAEVEDDDTSGWEWSVAFADNREVAVGRRADGTYFPNGMNVSQAELTIGETTVDQGWRFAFIYDDNDEVTFGQRTDGSFFPDTIGGAVDQTSVVIHGDSLTAGWASTAALATALGYPVTAVGDGGEKSYWIAARQGGQPLLVTVTGGAIPASGSVAVTFAYAPIVGATNTGNPSASTLQGSLSGVAGALQTTGSLTGTFTRNSPGRITPAPASTRFITGSAYRDSWPILWAGRNNFTGTLDADQIVADTRAMLAYSRNPDHALVLSILPWVGEENGTGNRTKLDAANAALAAAFPTQYEDIGARLRSADLLTALGITPSGTDTTNISNGLTPDSLRYDSGHLDTDGYAAMNLLITEIYTSRGWI